MKTKLLIGLVVVALASSCPALCAQQRSQEKATVSHLMDNLEITVGKVNGRKVSFTVKNGGASAVKVVKDYLPWNTTSALKLLAVPIVKGAASVEALQPIEDPRATIVEIPGKGELRGELDLLPLFPRWNELTQGGVLLVWSLSLSEVETAETRRFNGVIEYQAK